MNEQKIDENVIDQSHVTKQAKILLDKPITENGIVVFDFMPSLQNIVKAKIVINLWMNQDIQQEIVKFLRSGIIPNFREWGDQLKEVKNNIVAKIYRMALPHFISSKLMYIVPAVEKSIFQWIKYHYLFILNASDYSKCSSMDFISNITWTARGKIDYAQTARNILANPDICLSTDTKFKLACTYCLEKEIALLLPNVVNKYYGNTINFSMHPMIGFWTTHIKGDSIKLYDLMCFEYSSRNRNMSINECILQMLIENDSITKSTSNEVAILYMWNKLSAEEKNKNITSLIKKMDNHDLKYIFISNLEYEQQQDIFNECSYSILVGILKDWSWEEYFLPMALHCLDVMNPSDFLSILKSIIILKINDLQKENEFMYNQYKFIFKELWQKCSRKLKDFVFGHENGCFLRDCLIALACKQNLDIIGLILNDLNIQQKTNVISGLHGIECCFHLIQSNMWDVLELLINPSLFSEDDINQFKQALVTEKGRCIAKHFLEQNAYDKIEYFMRWAFNSQKEIDQFRKSLSHDVICEATLKTIVNCNKTDFTDLEIHFNWCAKGEMKIINEFKAEVPKSFGGRFISELIQNNRCDLLDKVLNWCFLDNQQKIAQFKSNMCKYDELGCCINPITI